MTNYKHRAREWYAQELNEQPPDCPCYEQHIASLAALLRAEHDAAFEECACILDAYAASMEPGWEMEAAAARGHAATIRESAQIPHTDLRNPLRPG